MYLPVLVIPQGRNHRLYDYLPFLSFKAGGGELGGFVFY